MNDLEHELQNIEIEKVDFNQTLKTMRLEKATELNIDKLLNYFYQNFEIIIKVVKLKHEEYGLLKKSRYFLSEMKYKHLDGNTYHGLGNLRFYSHSVYFQNSWLNESKIL